MRFSSDGKQLVSWGEDSALQVWNTRVKKLEASWNAGKGRIHDVAFSRDGKSVISEIEQWTICRWDARTGKKQFRWNEWRYQISCMSISADGRTAALGRYGSPLSVRLIDLVKETDIIRHHGHRAEITGLAFSPDGKQIASCAWAYEDIIARIWETTTGRLTHELEGHTAGVSDVVYSPNGALLASSGILDETIRLWDPTTAKTLTVLDCPGGLRPRLAFSPDSRLLVSALPDDLRLDSPRIRIWSMPSGRMVSDHSETGHQTNTVAFSASGRLVYQRGDSMLLRKMPDGALDQCIFIGENISFGSISPDESLLACTIDNRRGSVREILTGEEVFGVESDGPIAFSPDGTLLAMGNYPGKIQLVNTRTGKQIQVIGAHPFGRVTQLGFSRNGNTLASGGYDTTILLWDMTEVRKKLPFQKNVEIDRQQWDAAWQDLRGEAAHAWKASWVLAQDPKQTLVILKSVLKPAPGLQVNRIPALIADLDSAEFPTREKANVELWKLGRLAEAALRKAQQDSPSLEVRRSARQLLNDVEKNRLPPDILQALRAVRVLEWIDAPGARAILTNLAKGEPTAQLTQEATMALLRMDKRAALRAP
jgi:WD40 repeat protein